MSERSKSSARMNPESLARAMLELFLAEMVMCRDDFEEEDVRFWSESYHRDARRASEVSREIGAYQAAKRRLRMSRAGNPRNVAAVLLYNVSHSAARDKAKHAEWQERISEGFALDRIKLVHEALDLIRDLRGAHLSEHAVGELVGRVVNLDRVSKLVREEYERLERGEIHGKR